jgi:hypothetical protein
LSLRTCALQCNMPNSCHHHAAPAAIMQPLLPLCGPCCLHAAPSEVRQPQLLSCGPLLPSGVPLLVSCGPLLLSCGPLLLSCGPLLPSCSPCRYQASLARTASPLLYYCSLFPSFPAWSTEVESGGAPVAALNLPPSAVVNPRTSWGKIHQRPAYIL